MGKVARNAMPGNVEPDNAGAQARHDAVMAELTAIRADVREALAIGRHAEREARATRAVVRNTLTTAHGGTRILEVPTTERGQDGAYLLRPPHQLRTIAALRRLSIANLQAWLDYYGQPYPDDADRSALLALLFSELGVPANATVNNLHGRPH